MQTRMVQGFLRLAFLSGNALSLLAQRENSERASPFKPAGFYRAARLLSVSLHRKTLQCAGRPRAWSGPAFRPERALSFFEALVNNDETRSGTDMEILIGLAIAVGVVYGMIVSRPFRAAVLIVAGGFAV